MGRSSLVRLSSIFTCPCTHHMYTGPPPSSHSQVEHHHPPTPSDPLPSRPARPPSICLHPRCDSHRPFLRVAPHSRACPPVLQRKHHPTVRVCRLHPSVAEPEPVTVSVSAVAQAAAGRLPLLLRPVYPTVVRLPLQTASVRLLVIWVVMRIRHLRLLHGSGTRAVSDIAM